MHQILIIQKLHILFEVALHIADTCCITFVLEALHIQRIQIRSKHITFKVNLSTYKCGVDQIDQFLAFDTVIFMEKFCTPVSRGLM